MSAATTAATEPPTSNVASKFLIVIVTILTDIVASIVFVYWAVIIFQSARNQYKFGRGDKTEKTEMYAMHAIAMVSNVLYVTYEIGQGDLHLIPVEFTMYFLLNLISIWTFVVITRVEAGAENASPVSPTLIKVRYGFIALLGIIYLTSFFTGTLGTQCGPGTNTKALWLLSLFWLLWTTFVFGVLKDDDNLRL